jgi:hypothetical protein
MFASRTVCVNKILHDKLEHKVLANNYNLVLGLRVGRYVSRCVNKILHDKLEHKVQGKNSKLVLCL